MVNKIAISVLSLMLTGTLLANYSPMKVEQVTGGGKRVTVTTTGGVYEIERTGIRLIRRVDPRTNTINPRLVAEIKFAADPGKLHVESKDAETAIVRSDAASFRFNGDSLFFLTANSPLGYTFTNLVKDAPWNKGLGLDRMWTDGYGGSLHANVSGGSKAVSSGPDFTEVRMSGGDRMAFMVYPPRLFDFEGLYGKNARPHVHFLTDDYKETLMMEDKATLMTEELMTEEDIEPYIRNGFGLFVLWKIYEYPDEDQSRPMLLERGNMGYKVRDPASLKKFIEFVHERGFKVISYFVFLRNPKWQFPAGHAKAGQYQDVDDILNWMKEFQEEHNFDGWYIDGAETGDFMTDYNFMRRVRKDVGDDGIIYYHNSIDPWGYNIGREHRFDGLKAIFLGACANYTLSGEMGDHASVHSPNDPYYRFYTGGYGLSQTYAAHKRKTYMDVALSEAENDRVIGENLNGTQRTRLERVWRPSWASHFKPAFDRRKAEYLSGKFNPDVAWPVDSERGWFRKPLNVSIESKSGTWITISWETHEAADGEVAYTSNNVWWPRYESESEVRYSKDGVKLPWPPPGVVSGPEGTMAESGRGTKHSVTIRDLNPNTEYQFRIRSTNGRDVPQEIIWQDIVRWKTGEGDFSRAGDHPTAAERHQQVASATALLAQPSATQKQILSSKK